MFGECKVREIYCMGDDFWKEFGLEEEKYMIEESKKKDGKKGKGMSDGEIMVIVIVLDCGGLGCLKDYYKEYVWKDVKEVFGGEVWYNGFVEVEKEIVVGVRMLIKKVLMGRCRGMSFVEWSGLGVCGKERIVIDKRFEGVGEGGKWWMGWLLGLKLDVIMNDKGEIVNLMFRGGNVDDGEGLKEGKLVEKIKGKVCGDKGYIGEGLFENVLVKGIEVVRKVKRKMKN